MRWDKLGIFSLARSLFGGQLFEGQFVHQPPLDKHFKFYFTLGMKLSSHLSITIFYLFSNHHALFLGNLILNVSTFVRVCVCARV